MPEIRSKVQTVIKRSMQMSGLLKPKDLIQVNKNETFVVESIKFVNNHYQIRLNGNDYYIWGQHWDIPEDTKLTVKAEGHQKLYGAFRQVVKKLDISQPNGYTCQAACAAMAVGTTNVMGVRNELERIGNPGDPSVVGTYIERSLGRNRHKLSLNASINDMIEWLKAGEFLITYGWFTGSGHVIGLDGCMITETSRKFDVDDPWSEFDFGSWSYNKAGVNYYDGYYSELGIYAACVASSGPSDARSIYNAGIVDPNRKGAWVNRVIVL